MRGFRTIKVLALLALVLGLCVLLWQRLGLIARETPETEPAASAAPAETEAPAPETGKEDAPEESPAPTPESTPEPVTYDEDAEKIRISELMIRNRATLPDEEGDFPDWIELENVSDEEVDLTGWRLSDREGKPGWTFPETRLAPGERILIFASGKDLPGHAGFSLSEGETLYLYTDLGVLAQQLLCPEGEADLAWLPDGEGGCVPSRYPTPGLPNTNESYDAIMAARTTDSPLVINEVCTWQRNSRWKDTLGTSDWIELKNVSDQTVRLSDYYLSDDVDDRLLYRLPERNLGPGDLFLVRCDKDPSSLGTANHCALFGLDSTADRVYLSREDGSLADYVSLRDIPFEGSYGRNSGENGWFFLTEPTPGKANKAGMRRVSATPVSLSADGVFEDVDSVTVTLSGSGVIHYTTDASYPTADSPVYTEPITVKKTSVVRAIAVEDGALPSRALTLNYIMNEHHTLPVVCLNADNARFHWMYREKKKGLESACTLSFYEEGGGFTLSCGVKMHGETSLSLPKKNMSVRFRGAYGQDHLDYDIFGGGVTEFDNLVLRAGQDYYHAIIRNELCTELARAASDKVVVSRSRYCILYIDGVYSGIYAVEEKLNESMYAHLAGVSRDSVITETPPLYAGHQMYKEVLSYAETHDLSKPENYEEICNRLDVESVADWLILEGVFANPDLTYGNVRYVRSTENDGKWRLMFYDMDSALYSADACFDNLLSPYSRNKRQVAHLIDLLLRNSDFRELVLKRASEMLSGPLSNEKIVEEIDLLAETIDPEVERDYARYRMVKKDWKWNVDWLRDFIQKNNWNKICINKICSYLHVTKQERAYYFGD